MDCSLRHLVIITALLSGVVAADEPPTLRVLTYNIHHGAGTDGQIDLPRIARVIRRTDPDVVMLQEVDRVVARSGGVDQVEQLGRLTKLHATFGANIPLQGGQYGNAILSRWPPLETRNVQLPSRGNGEQRGVLMVDVAWPTQRHRLRLLGTHWDHRGDDQERLASAERLNQLAMEVGSLPAVLAGDLNATPDSCVLLRLREQWQTAGNVPLPTIPAEEPTRQIDFVLVRPHDAWAAVEVTVLDEPVASDHRPLLAVLKLKAMAAWPSEQPTRTGVCRGTSVPDDQD